jgi:hypothetical protein
MRRLLRMWVVTAIMIPLVWMAGGGVVAQETPDSGPVANIPNPMLGDSVSYITESGSEVARLSAASIELEWVGYSEYYPPTEGSQYVAIVVEVTNLGSRGNLIVRADDFRLQDVDGFFYSRSWADASESADLIPAASEVAIAPGTTTEVVLVYEVLTGVELTHLFWQPDYGRLLTIANLDGTIPGVSQ